MSESPSTAVPLVKAGLFVVAEVDGKLLCDADQRTLMLHVSALVAAGTDITLEDQAFEVAEVVHREADVPMLRLRAKP
ncbi:MAG: hypothetical protein KC457_07310 [Myxococcales bacterium]|nr:hypothetical protein [Myxococcales bacterium]